MSSDAIEDALVTALALDATLVGLAPGGVWQDIAPDHVSETFVVWAQMSANDTRVQASTNQRKLEDVQVMVKALATSRESARAAAVRIDAILEGVRLTITGYRARSLGRIERVSYVERTDVETWYHRGGVYRLAVETA